jgi:nitrogen regulatory protein P-II 1
MRKIEAVIRHEAMEGLRRSLADEGLPSVSVAEVTTFARRGERMVRRPRLSLEMVVQVEDLERAVDLVVRHARTGRPGDGAVFVLPVDDAIRVRTTQRGREVVVAHTGLDG